MQALVSITFGIFALAAAAVAGTRGDVSAVAGALQPDLESIRRIPVRPGGSANAAARTLIELRRILADKVADGELSQADADRILRSYGGVLVVYAQGSSGKTSAVPPIASAPVIQRAPAPASASRPVSATSTASSSTNSSQNTSNEGPSVSVNVNTFNELAVLLAPRRKTAESAIYATATGDSTDVDSERPTSPRWGSFGFGGSENGTGLGAPRFEERAPVASAASELRLVSGENKNDRRKVATLAAVGFAKRDETPVTGLSTMQRLRFLAGLETVTDDDGERIDPPYPAWLNWFFGTILTMLCARAAWQWRRARLIS